MSDWKSRFPLLPPWLPTLAEAMVHIAMTKGNNPVPMREAGRRAGAEPRYLEKYQAALVAHGILKGKRGPNGGFLLARSPSTITVGDLYRIWLDQLKFDEDPWPRSEFGAKMEQVFRLAETRMIAELDAVTIDDLMNTVLTNG
jgi:Rrf2 family protein